MATTRRITGLTPSRQTAPQTQTLRADPERLDIAALGGAKVNVDVPADATLEQVEGTIGILVQAHGRLSQAQDHIKFMIGKLVNVVRERRLYVPKYSNFTAYVESMAEKFGMARGTAFEAERIGRKFPSLTKEQYVRYGSSRLLEASKVTDGSDPKHVEFLNAAQKMSVAALRTHIKDMQAQAKQPPTLTGEANAAGTLEVVATVTIKTTSRVRDLWQSALQASGMGASEFFESLLSTWESSTSEAEEETEVDAA